MPLHSPSFTQAASFLKSGCQTRRREALRRQFTRRSQLVRHRTRLKNEVHAILNANLIGRCPVTDLFTSTGRKWLAEQVLASSDREAVARGFREIERIGEDLAALDR